jgi:hypothetical protein
MGLDGNIDMNDVVGITISQSLAIGIRENVVRGSSDRR